MRILWIGLLLAAHCLWFTCHHSPHPLRTQCERNTVVEGKSQDHLVRDKRMVPCSGKVISLVNTSSALSSACFGLEAFCCPFYKQKYL